MAIPNVTEDNTFENWLAATNLIANSVGDLTLLNTSAKSSLVAAVNEIVSGVVSASTITISGTATFNGTVNIGDAGSDTVTWKSTAVSIPNGINFGSGIAFFDTASGRVGFGTSAGPIAPVEVKASNINSGVVGRYGIAVNDSAVNATGVGGGISFFSNGTELGNARSYKEGAGSNASSFYISSHNGTSLVPRLQITSAGVIVSGSNNTQDLGSSTNRWANIYAVNESITGVLDLNGTSVATASGVVNFASNKAVIDTVNGWVGVSTVPSRPLEVKLDGVSTTPGREVCKITNTAGDKGLGIGYNNTTQRTVLTSLSSGTSSGMEIWNYNSVATSYEKNFQMDQTGVGEFVKAGVKVSNTAYASSTVLDWYEEGEFYPTLEINGTQSSSFVDRIGSYTRIGNRVYFNGTIKLSSLVGAGTVKIGALPWTAKNTTNKEIALSVFAYNMAAGVGTVVARIIPNTSKVELGYVSSGSLTTLSDTHLASNTIINVAGHYEV